MIKCETLNCDSDAVTGLTLCSKCLEREYPWYRRGMKKVLGVPNAKQLVGGKR